MADAAGARDRRPEVRPEAARLAARAQRLPRARADRPCSSCWAADLRRQLPLQHPRQRRPIFNWARLNIIILQVSIIGIIAIGVTQVIITGGIDLSSGSIVGATAMITMSFAQTAMVNGNPNPKAIFGDWAMDLPVIVPIVVGLPAGWRRG
jgi:hypothetical protein